MNIEPLNKELKDPNLNYEEFRKDFSNELPAEVIDVSELNKAEAEKQMERYAILSSSSYETYKHGSEKSQSMIQKLLPDYTIDKNLSDDLSTTIVNIRSDGTKDVIISYRGSQNLTDVGVDLFQIIPGAPLEKLGGLNTGRFKTSQDKYDEVKKSYPNANITTTGHSLGSSMAYYIGKTNNVKSYGFNTGSSPLDLITNMAIKNNPENQFTHYYTAGDVVGLSQSILGSKEDKLIVIKPHKWIEDLSTTVASTIVAGPIGLSLGTLATLIDIHGLSNFLPSKAFNGTLQDDDIAYRWVKNIHHSINEKTRVSSLGKIHNFINNEPIEMGYFIKKCKNGIKQGCLSKEEGEGEAIM